MNFFKPLCARDFPAFEIIPEAIPSAAITEIYSRVVPNLPPAHPKQSGSVLTKLAHLAAYLEPLRERISQKFHTHMYLRLDKSSYRSQTPDGAGALPLHQDYLPLQELILPRWRRSTWKHTDPASEPACTVWLPLVDIDEKTPTLEVSPVLPGRVYKHVPDDAGYLVMAEDHDCAALVQLSRLQAGTGVFLTSLTLHRSCVRPWHTKTRASFDLRFLPRPPPEYMRPDFPVTTGRRPKPFYIRLQDKR